MSTDRRQRLDDYLLRRRQVLQGGVAAAAALALPGARAHLSPRRDRRNSPW